MMTACDMYTRWFPSMATGFADSEATQSGQEVKCDDQDPETSEGST